MVTTLYNKVLIIFAVTIFSFLIPDIHSIECDSCTLCNQYANIYGNTVELNQSIYSSGTCISTTNESVTIDCKGFSINGSKVLYGIVIDKNNITVKNCNIENYSIGIYITNKNNNTIINNTLNSSTYGIYMLSTANNNITQNTIINNAYGIKMQTSNNNIIFSNKIKNNTNYEINITGNDNNITRNYFKKSVLPITNYPAGTIFENNIFADWTAGPLSNYLSDFPTITGALSISSSGDIIYAFRNQYLECPTITKSITLTGEERDSTKISCPAGTALNITENSAIFGNFTLATQDSASPALTITANSTTISNISIKNHASGIKIDSSDNNTLKNLKLENLTYSINITSSTGTTINMSAITNGTIHAFHSQGILISNITFSSGPSGYSIEAIFLENTNNSEILWNTYDNVPSQNIRILKSTGINITDNTFRADTATTYTPLSLENTTNSRILRNTINNSYYGVMANNADSLTIGSNIINSTFETCIMAMNTNNTIITNNTLSAAKTGLHISSGNFNTIYNNTIKYMTIAAIDLRHEPQTIWSESNSTLFHATFDSWSTTTNCQNATGEGWTRCNSIGGYWRAETGNNPLNTSSSKAFRGSGINFYGDAYLIKCLNLSSYTGAYLNFSWNTTGLSGDEGIKIYSNRTGIPTFIEFWYSGSADTSWTGKEIDVTSNISANTCFKMECRATTNADICYIDDFKIIGKTYEWTTETDNTVYLNNTIEKNTIMNSGTAISLKNTRATRISQNTITNITGAKSVTLENTTEDNITCNTLTTGSIAISLFNTNHTFIQGNTFSNHTLASIYFNWSSTYNTENTIKDNIIAGRGTDTGLEIMTNVDITITNNTISETSTGIRAYNTNYSTIANNTITYASSYGIGLQFSKENSIDNNTILHCKWNAIYATGNPSSPDTNSTIKNNYVYNATKGINLQYITNSTISNNTLEYTREGLYLLQCRNSSITENTFKTNTNYGININDTVSTNNSLFMNNFSDSSNIFQATFNSYCVLGLDNYYPNNPLYDNPPYSCFRSFIASFNDSTVYINDTVLFSINTSFGASNITALNITINNTNYTTTRTSGTGIKGLWTYAYTGTLSKGTYYATQIYYEEADNDKGINTTLFSSFEVTDLTIATNITPKNASIWSTIRINATVENNATNIDYVKSDIYWNNTLVDQKSNSSFEKISATKRIYQIYTSNTSRSGTYTVNTTVVAGQNKSYEDTFTINYGTANITIDSTPQLIAYNITPLQNYTIKALYGDLNNVTITFRSTNESIINITTASQTMPYMNISETQYLSINLTGTGIGIADINITATPQNGTANSKTKSIEVRRMNLTAYAAPETANVTNYITITADVQNNVSEIRNVSAEIYWNRSLIGTIPLAFASSTETTGNGNNQNYRYTTSTTLTNRSGNYTVNVTAVSTTNATGSDTYYINYGTANISISASPTMINTGTEKNHSFTITAVNGDLENIMLTYTSNNSSILNITTESQLIPSMNSSTTRQLNISIAAINAGAARINITAVPGKGTSDTKAKNITTKELRIDTYLNTTTINITNQIRIYANITGNITAIDYVLANITWNGTIKQQIYLQYHNYDSTEEKHIYTQLITSTDRSGNYTVTTTVKAEITANDTDTFFVNYGRAIVNLDAEPYAITNGNESEQWYRITASGGDIANISSIISFNDTSKLYINATENTTKQIPYIFNTNTSPLIWILDAKNVGSVLLNITTTTQGAETSASKQITITGEADTAPPNVHETWTQYTQYETQRSSTFNLMDTAYIYANVSDNYAVKTVQANITIPNKTSEIITLQRAIVEGIYNGPFTNTTELDQYNIQIIASDGTNTNNTETQNFTTTDIYPLTIIQTESLYNRGENATITISAYGRNGNLVTAFNTSLNITYESNTTILLDRENTDTAYYYINTSVLGTHNMTANITKNGNTGTNTSEFYVTNILNMSYQTDIEKYPPTTPIRRFLLYVNYGRNDAYLNDVNATLYCYNNTQENLEYVPLKKDTSNIYTYMNSTGPPECFPPNSFCTQYNIEANITDAYNNTGTESFTLNSYCYTQQSASSSSGGSSSASSGGGPGILSGLPEKIKEYIFGNQTNRTIVNDFAFTLNRKEAVIKQGENTTIIGTLDNIGETDRLIETEITQDCCNVRTENTRYFIQSRNKEDIPIHIHNSLKTIPGEYLINVVMKSENITKRETIRITIEKNPMITDLENLESKTPGLEQNIESYATAGVDIAYLKDATNDLKTLIKAAREAIERDDIENLKKNLDAAKKKYDYINLELLKLNSMKWLSENKYNIVVAGITTIFLSYMLIYFIIPYYYLKKELTGLLTKEIELKYSEKAIQKQYFMRQLDEHSFNRLLSDEHGKLLDTRSHIKQIEEKITLLKRGKLNIMDKEHSKYFILKKIAPKQKRLQDITIHREEELKSLKNQEYNINQSSKEAEKKYYCEIITQEELEQILSSNNSKLEAIRKKELEILSKDHPAEIQKTIPKRDIIREFRKKYDQYRLNKEEKHIEAKIKELEKDEHNLERTNEEIKAKKDNIENEIETLKKEDLMLKEKEKNINS